MSSMSGPPHPKQTPLPFTQPGIPSCTSYAPQRLIWHSSQCSSHHKHLRRRKQGAPLVFHKNPGFHLDSPLLNPSSCLESPQSVPDPRCATQPHTSGFPLGRAGGHPGVPYRHPRCTTQPHTHNNESSLDMGSPWHAGTPSVPNIRESPRVHKHPRCAIWPHTNVSSLGTHPTCATQPQTQQWIPFG